jgi:inhibitor of cysteine peptidase
MKLIWSVAAATALFVSSAAAGQAQVNAPGKMVVLTEKDHDRTVDLRVGEPISVNLPENATTGYRWAIESIDPQLIEVRATEAEYPTNAIGAAGEARWTFVAEASGTTEITLKRWRHWEGDASIVQRFRLRVRILP